METFALKIFLCSGILLGLYHWFLAKEKTLVFNRFYLIFSVIFFLFIPFLTIELSEFTKEKPMLLIEQEIPQPILTVQIIEEKSFDFTQIIMTVYFLIAVFLLAKFIFSILKIKNLKGRKIIYKSRNVILLKPDLAPFSFWNTIYISEKSFTDFEIDERVFLHEEIHIQQKHSLDLIFIELIKSILWLNPFFYFYKNAMINNHEFLADEEVINQNTDIKNYQELILQEVMKQQNLTLTHQFNFNNTKKRFIMMTKQNSKFAKAKKMIALPLFAITTVVFAEKVYANDKISAPEIKLEKKFQNEKVLFSQEFFKKVKTDTISPKKARETKAEIKKITPDEINANDAPPVAAPKIVQTGEQIPAEYPGGIHVMRMFVGNNFDSGVFDKNTTGTMKTSIFISIDENGKTTKIKTEEDNMVFNKEAERVVKLATDNKTWKPAIENGIPVKSVFKLPLTMRFN